MTSKNYILLQATDLIFNVVYINTIALRNIWILGRVSQLTHLPSFQAMTKSWIIQEKQDKKLQKGWANVRVRAALLKIKSTTYKLFFPIFLTTVLL